MNPEVLEIRSKLTKRSSEELARFRLKLFAVGGERAMLIRENIIAVLMRRYLAGESIPSEIRAEFDVLRRRARIERLERGEWSFGHYGTHRGNGTEHCPLEPHHHHDAFCTLPTADELEEAGIDVKSFKNKKRGNDRARAARQV